jgi:hypothetical protein
MNLTEEVIEGNILIARFMGYEYFERGVMIENDNGRYEECDVFAKVPILLEETPGGGWKEFKEVPNPDFGNQDNPTWNNERQFLSWATLNKYISDPQYHTSWDWLMPVVEKIENESWGKFIISSELEETENATVFTRHHDAVIEFEPDEGFKMIEATSTASKIEAVWQACVQFINYLNSNEMSKEQVPASPDPKAEEIFDKYAKSYHGIDVIPKSVFVKIWEEYRSITPVLRWVKASERLPEKEYSNYVIRHEGKMSIACFSKQIGWEFIHNGKIAVEPLKYEWLDEESPVALPEDRLEGDLVAGDRIRNEADVASHSSGVGNSIEQEWKSVKEHGYPEHNVGLLVFIPEEDFHITSGMWDVSNKWVLLDEYRVPDCEVTHYKVLPDIPKEYQKEQKENEAVMSFLSKSKYLLNSEQNTEPSAATEDNNSSIAGDINSSKDKSLEEAAHWLAKDYASYLKVEHGRIDDLNTEKEFDDYVRMMKVFPEYIERFGQAEHKEEKQEQVEASSPSEPITHYHVADNSDGFRDWLKQNGIDYESNGHYTSIELQGNDIFSIGYRFALYKQEAMQAKKSGVEPSSLSEDWNKLSDEFVDFWNPRHDPITILNWFKENMAKKLHPYSEGLEEERENLDTGNSNSD